MKTHQVKNRAIKRDWYHFDASNKVLGRLATKIAGLLMGKHKTAFSYHLDVGDFVVVTNAKRVKVTGNKRKSKIYYRFTGYLGNLKEISLKELMIKKPEAVIQKAVLGMLPKNKLRKRRMKRLRIFAEDNHPYQDKNLKEVN